MSMDGLGEVTSSTSTSTSSQPTVATGPAYTSASGQMGPYSVRYFNVGSCIASPIRTGVDSIAGSTPSQERVVEIQQSTRYLQQVSQQLLVHSILRN